MGTPDPGAVGGGRLPVGVVLPCRNSAAYLPGHLAAVATWIDLAREVVVVDSDSTDGTLELLRQGLRHPEVAYLSHAPGLYASWNAGIARVRAPYTYIATVGDTITREGLVHLVEVAERFGSDVVISPPRFVAAAGLVVGDRQWPIHRLLGWLRPEAPVALGCRQAFLVTFLMNPSGALGSSAGNLYRTDLFQRAPFPTPYGHAGDTAWTLLHGLDVRWALTPRVVSEFLLHPGGAAGTGPELALERRFHELALEACARRGLDALRTELVELTRDRAALAEASRELHERRSRGARWLLDPAAWRARSRRARLRARVEARERELVAREFAPVAPTASAP